MREFRHGTLRSSGSGKRVANPRQAIAIRLSEACQARAKVPPEPLNSIGRHAYRQISLLTVQGCVVDIASTVSCSQRWSVASSSSNCDIALHRRPVADRGSKLGTTSHCRSLNSEVCRPGASSESTEQPHGTAEFRNGHILRMPPRNMQTHNSVSFRSASCGNRAVLFRAPIIRSSCSLRT